MKYTIALDLTEEQIKTLKHRAIEADMHVKELVKRMVESYLTKRIDPEIIEEER